MDVSITVPAISLIMALVGILVGRKMSDPTDKIDSISRQIEQETKRIKENLQPERFKKQINRLEIADSTEKIGDLSSRLGELGVCKEISKYSEFLLGVMLIFMLSSVCLLLLPIIESEKSEVDPGILKVVGLIIVLVVLLCSSLSLFYFFLYKIHRR